MLDHHAASSASHLAREKMLLSPANAGRLRLIQRDVASMCIPCVAWRIHDADGLSALYKDAGLAGHRR